MTLAATYASEGHAVDVAALDPALIDHLRMSIEAQFDVDDARPLTLSQFNIRALVPMVMEIVTAERLLRRARELLGAPKIRLWQEQIIVKPPRVGAETGWHQDYAYWPMVTPTAVTCWIPLHDVDLRTGSLRFFPGSHRWGNRPSLLPKSTEEVRCLARTPQAVHSVDQPMRKGDCSFHHGLVFHGASANASSKHRLAFKAVYMADGTRYRAQSHALTEGCGFLDGDAIEGTAFPRLC